MVEHLLIGLGIAVAFAYGTTPYAISLAERYAFYDKPKGYKSHSRPTPYLGGAAVMIGFVCALLAAAGHPSRTLPLTGGVVVLWAVGTVDDRRGISPLARVIVEVALSAVVWSTDIGWHTGLGAIVDLGLTCAWIVGVINAFNLFDNMDGAASMMALAVSAGAAVLGVVNGDAWLAVGAASLGGACLGFLPRNLSRPARIFLGDGGSMPVGFAVAVLVMAAATASAGPWQSLLVGLLLVGIPAVDTCLVVVSRRRRGVPILTGGRDHLTHRTRRLLPSAGAVAFALAGVQVSFSAVAVLAAQGGSAIVVYSAVLYLIAAACAIAVLETQAVAEFASPKTTCAEQRRWNVPRTSPLAFATLLLLGFGAGLSPFFAGYYSSGTWVPIGLVIVLLCAMGAVARPLRVGAPVALAAGGLLGLGVWSLCSAAWAQSVESAVVNGNMILVYAAFFMTALVVIRSDRRAAWLFGALSAGVVAVALSVLVRLFGPDPGALFLTGRLNEPLGYINGEGCLFVMGFWLCWAAAEQRRVLTAAAGAGLATLMASLAILSESRGTGLALAVSLVAVATAIPGRRRRLLGLTTVALGVALSAPSLLHVYQRSVGGLPPVGIAHAAARSILVSALAVALVWALAVGGYERLLVGDPANSRRLRAAGAVVLAVLATAIVVSGVVSASRIEHSVRSQWHAFTANLSDSGQALPGTAAAAGQSRLLSGGGNRYDYWRIAWRTFERHPVLGVGAGNYAIPYYRQRATADDTRQPHSLELQTLSELGVVGFACLVLLVAGLVLGVARMRASARCAGLTRGLLVGSSGVVIGWLTQTSVDWMHLLPGVTAIALAGGAVLVRQRSPEVAPVAVARRVLSRRLLSAGGIAGIFVALSLAGASLSRQGLAELFQSRAQDEMPSHPAAALADANRSLNIDSDATATYYIKAAALARFNQATAANDALDQALRHEPSNFITWALLGDLAVREGDLSAARADYFRAHTLNPRDTGLRQLSRDPGSSAS